MDAAERLFAEHGFHGTSLGGIAAAAAVSRATPSYFFGNKEDLYVAVLERVFADREAATEEAFRPLVDWTQSPSPGSLRPALSSAVEGYLAFLHARPSFVRLLQHEDLAGGRHLPAVRRKSIAMSTAFGQLRAVAPECELRRFPVEDVILVFVSLTFSPLAQRATFLAALRRDLDDPKSRHAHIELVVDQLLNVLTGHSSPRRPGT